MTLMELLHALRGTGAVRDFTDAPVDDATLARVLDTARFAPSGGNRQAWRVVVVRDGALRAGLAEVYRRGWYDYRAMQQAGLRPYAPTNDRAAERRAVALTPAIAAAAAETPGFAENFDRVPALLAVFCDLSALAAVDRDLDRYCLAGGASVYPFVWSILLAAHQEGLGGVLTTMPVREEPTVKKLLHVPDPLALAAVVALGYPRRRPTRLRRAPVADFATVDTLDGPALE